MEQKLHKYIREAGKARQTLSDKLGKTISSIDFQVALGEKLGYAQYDSTRVMDHELAAEQMLELLDQYPFSFPEEIGRIEFDDSILPQDVPRVLNEEQVKNNGEIWVVHKNDPDPFPSNPHGHNKQTGYKLHLGNGELYSRKNKPLGQKISKTHLLAIRGKVKNIPLPPLEV